MTNNTPGGGIIARMCDECNMLGGHDDGCSLHPDNRPPTADPHPCACGDSQHMHRLVAPIAQHQCYRVGCTCTDYRLAIGIPRQTQTIVLCPVPECPWIHVGYEIVFSGDETAEIVSELISQCRAALKTELREHLWLTHASQLPDLGPVER